MDKKAFLDYWEGELEKETDTVTRLETALDQLSLVVKDPDIERFIDSVLRMGWDEWKEYGDG